MAERTPGLYATFVTNQGTIVCRLFEKEAPKTVANFVELAEGKREWKDSLAARKARPLYNGTIFHRVIPNFMIQGGDPSGTGMGGPGYKFADETKGSPHRFEQPGKLAMANAGPNTNGSQFFITVAAHPGSPATTPSSAKSSKATTSSTKSAALPASPGPPKPP